MGLDRTELAARLAEADWRNPRAEPLPLGEWGRTLVAYADDLIAALALTPPVAPKSEAAKYTLAEAGRILAGRIRGDAKKIPAGEVARYFTSMSDGSISAYNLEMFAANRVESVASPAPLGDDTPAAGLPSPEATRPTKFRIRRGATVCQDFRYFAWPGEYEDRADTEFTERKPVMFAADRGVNAVAYGFGVHGDADGKSYGNGSIYVTDAVDLIPTPPAPVEPAKGEARAERIERCAANLSARLVDARLYTESGDAKYDSGWGVDEAHQRLIEAIEVALTPQVRA